MDKEMQQEFDTNKIPLKQRFLESGVNRPVYITIFILFAASIIVYIISRLSTGFAEFFARVPSQGLRFILSIPTSLFPFSVAETLLILLPVFGFIYLKYTFGQIKKDEKQFFAKCIMPLIAFIMVLLTVFFSAFAPCYFRKELSDNLGLERAGISPEELKATAIYLCEEVDKVINKINFNYSNASYINYSYNELVDKINIAFSKYASKADYITSFKSKPKAIALSQPMTYTHISGVYTFFTGEANINVNYPDFIIPFTMAHEMAHQRGIAREDEANFVAFLVCLESDDDYVRYSGLTNVLKYVMESLYSASKDMYTEVRSNYYPNKVSKEMAAYSIFFDKYRESTASKVTNTTNNGFLKSQGQTAGIKSYNLVVDLAVAYYNDLIK